MFVARSFVVLAVGLKCWLAVVKVVIGVAGCCRCLQVDLKRLLAVVKVAIGVVGCRRCLLGFVVAAIGSLG